MEEVASCIDKIRPSSSTGPDGVSNRTLKILKFQIVKPLTRIINANITSSHFPNIWKIGRVCPTFKRGAKDESTNYRPISLTSNIGKLVESVIRIQFVDALERVLPPNMHGFRSNRGTETALIQLTEKIKTLKSQGQQGPSR